MKIEVNGIEWCSAHSGVVNEGEVYCDLAPGDEDESPCQRHSVFYEKDEPRIGPNPFMLGTTEWQVWDDMQLHRFMIDLSDKDRRMMIEYVRDLHEPRKNESQAQMR